VAVTLPRMRFPQREGFESRTPGRAGRTSKREAVFWPSAFRITWRVKGCAGRGVVGATMTGASRAGDCWATWHDGRAGTPSRFPVPLLVGYRLDMASAQ